MTWLKGTTTWAALPQKLVQLLCGEVADDSSVTVATADRWLREFTRTVTDGVLNGTTTFSSPAQAAFTAADKGANLIGTGIPAGTVINSVTSSTAVVMSNPASGSASGVTVQIAHDTLRTPAIADATTGVCAMRCGYFSQVYNPADASGAVGRDSSLRITSPCTSDPSSSGFHRWVVTFTVTTANTVAGNYSTAVMREIVYDADTAATLVNTNRTPNAAGVFTGSNGAVYQVADASGTLVVSTVWQRGFTATYMYGIDHWKMLYRQGNTAPSFTIAPPGSAGTDYDVVRIPIPSYLTTGSGITSGVAFDAMVGTVWNTGNLFHGLGIKTAIGLGSNPQYTVTLSLALFKGRIFFSGTNGVLSLDVGQSMVDPVNATGGGYRVVGNYGVARYTTWLKCAQTPASVTNSTSVQYWISVKATGVLVMVNMDPGASGKFGNAMICTFTPADPTVDALPIAYNTAIWDYTADQSSNPVLNVFTQHRYLWLKRQQDGSEGSRDWQTKWMRADMDTASTQSAGNQQQTPAGFDPSSSGNAAAPPRQNKPSLDGKWWLYGYQFGEGGNSFGWGSFASVDEGRMIRGSWNSRFLFAPGDGWGHGDELTDGTTGQKYLLVMPDYLGFGARWRLTTNSFTGGVAVAEL